jgi:hypothetical protein
MDYALSTLGQGGTAHILMPTWGFNPTASSGLNFIEIDFVLHAADVNNGIGYIFGSGSSTQFSVSVDTAGALRFVTGSTPRIFSAAGFFVYGQRYLVRIEYNDTGSAATSWARMYANGVQVGADFVGLLTGVTINQIGRYSTTRHSEITVYSVATGGGAGSYDDSWNATTAGDPATGTTWNSTTGTRLLTITNQTGATDSWWFGYGAITPVQVTIAAGMPVPIASASTSTAAPALQATIAAGLPVPAIAVAVTDSTPVLQAVIAAGLPLPAAQAQTNAAAPAYSTSISAGLPVPFAAAVASIAYGNFPVSILAGLPVPQASIVSTVSSAGAFVVTIAAGLPIPTASAVGASAVPVLQSTIQAGLPLPSALVTLGFAAVRTEVAAGLPVPVGAVQTVVSSPEYQLTLVAGLPLPSVVVFVRVEIEDQIIAFSEGALAEIIEPKRFAELAYEGRFAQL